MIKINFSKIFNNEIDAQFQTESNFLIDQDIATPNQTHSSNVKFVTQPGSYDNTDGLVTLKKYKLKLMIKVADCVPIYLYDSKNQLYGLIHSGWRGTKNHIILNALEIFKKKGCSNFKDVKVFIGPHIKDLSYEVDWDVAQYFSFVCKNKKSKKWLLSLEKEIIFDCISEGILNENIFVSDICTFRSKDYESFRRDGEKSKRMLGILG
tara:strand:- start:3020 stop:3643 length:624 start_codon:yes stop_codon:yes gene_type:complete